MFELFHVEFKPSLHNHSNAYPSMANLTRFKKFQMFLIVATTTWLWFVNRYIEDADKPWYQGVHVLPGWLVIAFGCYSLLSIGKSLWDLVDYPEELVSLKGDVERAKAYWREHVPSILTKPRKAKK